MVDESWCIGFHNPQHVGSGGRSFPQPIVQSPQNPGNRLQFPDRSTLPARQLFLAPTYPAMAHTSPESLFAMAFPKRYTDPHRSHPEKGIGRTLENYCKIESPPRERNALRTFSCLLCVLLAILVFIPLLPLLLFCFVLGLQPQRHSIIRQVHSPDCFSVPFVHQHFIPLSIVFILPVLVECLKHLHHHFGWQEAHRKVCHLFFWKPDAFLSAPGDPLILMLAELTYAGHS